MCDSGFQFENGASSAMVDCDLFEGKKSADIPKCVRIGKALSWSFLLLLVLYIQAIYFSVMLGRFFLFPVFLW